MWRGGDVMDPKKGIRLMLLSVICRALGYISHIYNFVIFMVNKFTHFIANYTYLACILLIRMSG
jgi:hypothetical protein